VSRVRVPRVVRLAIAVLVVAFLSGATAVERRRMNTSAFRSAGSAAGAARVDPTTLMADVQALAAPSMEGRLTGSPGNRRAQAYITDRFRELGLKPLDGGYGQKFSFTRKSIKGLVLPGRPYRTDFPDATNLVASLPGTGRPDAYLVISAHYDHLGVRDGQTYAGADDNASGVAAMLAAAAYFSAHPLRHSLLFIAFDGEEEGLQGSTYFVGHPPIDLSKVALELNLDMVSRSDSSSIVASGTSSHPALRDLVASAARGRNLTIQFGHDRPFYVAGGVEDWTHSSDHGPFHDAGVPTLYYGVEDHEDYHRPGDTADKIPRAFFVEVANLVVETLIAADVTSF
jgi:Zn-dependent M28 family amino/carboxypeptidase